MAPIKNDRSLTLNRLKELLDYDPGVGKFVWRIHPPGSKVRAGSVAGSIQGRGYRIIKIGGIHYKASRLAWFYVHGQWPDGYLDHANGIKDDDRLCNIREATLKDNAANRMICGRTGIKGVYKTRSGTYSVAIRRDGKYIYLGTYGNINDAAAARTAAALKIHGNFASELR